MVLLANYGIEGDAMSEGFIRVSDLIPVPRQWLWPLQGGLKGLSEQSHRQSDSAVFFGWQRRLLLCRLGQSGSFAILHYRPYLDQFLGSICGCFGQIRDNPYGIVEMLKSCIFAKFILLESPFSDFWEPELLMPSLPLVCELDKFTEQVHRHFAEPSALLLGIGS